MDQVFSNGMNPIVSENWECNILQMTMPRDLVVVCYLLLQPTVLAEAYLKLNQQQHLSSWDSRSTCGIATTTPGLTICPVSIPIAGRHLRKAISTLSLLPFAPSTLVPATSPNRSFLRTGSILKPEILFPRHVLPTRTSKSGSMTNSQGR